jgi:hypothetical protein
MNLGKCYCVDVFFSGFFNLPLWIIFWFVYWFRQSMNLMILEKLVQTTFIRYYIDLKKLKIDKILFFLLKSLKYISQIIGLIWQQIFHDNMNSLFI